MQFHHNGFRPGDPRIADPVAALVAPVAERPLPAEVDVLIVGSGPTGLVLAAQLAQFPELSVCLAEAKPGPLQLGQADGVACRTMEMFHAFGFARRVEDEAYWVNETVFWNPDPADPERIARSDRIQDVEDGLSEFPHVILNQARIHDHLLEKMRHSPTGLVPHYSRRLVDLDLPTNDKPVVAHFTVEAAGEAQTTESVRARYVVGCDGARSAVRRAMGLRLIGDAANHAWGVMDVLAVTDFPDIRYKCVIHSSQGSMLIIPREGGYLARLYIELDKLRSDERVADRNITIDQLIEGGRRILAPYSLTVEEVAWWSIYEIGQRMTERYDNVTPDNADAEPRVFIAGDACHTHSPKAGQGMNVSMRDGFNLGWKLASVLRGQATPELLHTYSAERHAVAKELIDFDRELAAMFAARPSTGSADGLDTAEFQRYFQRQGRFTAGVETRYSPSMITGPSTHQDLAVGFEIGTRFHSAPVIRSADAKPMHLGHVVEADGRWRLFLFADADGTLLDELCHFLEQDESSPVRRHTAAASDIDSVIDVRGVVQQHHHDVVWHEVPSLLRPAKGRYHLTDYQKLYSPDLKTGLDIFDHRGVNREAGAVVVVRPDQHVAHVLPLSAHTELTDFFAGFMIDRT